MISKLFLKKESFALAKAHFDSIIGEGKFTMYPLSSKPDKAGIGIVKTFVLSEKIRHYCKLNGVKESIFFLTVLLHVLHRVTREERVLISAISSGGHLDMFRTVGRCVTSLPVSNHLDSEILFVESAKVIQRQVRASTNYEMYPMTILGIHPQVEYNYHGNVNSRKPMKGVGESDVALDTSMIPLSLYVISFDSRYQLILRYDTSKYSENDMRLLDEMLKKYCINAVEEGARLKDIEMTDDKQRQEIMKLSKGEELRYDYSKTFVDLFLEQVHLCPDSLAASDDMNNLTFAELDRMSDAIAWYLLGRGVKQGDLVPLVLGRSVKFPIAFIGVMKAGAAYVPIDPTYPEERKRYMIEDCEASAILDDLLVGSILNNRGTSNPINLAIPEGRAYMIYTSGSTGKPKGALLHHAGLVNFIHSVIKIDGLRPLDRVSGYQAFTFDGHVEEFFPTLAVGASVHIMPESIRKDSVAISDFIVQHDVTGCGFPTKIAELMLQNHDLPVRYLIAGGEKLQHNRECKTVIINTYGPTECTVEASYFKIEPGKKYDNIPIGYPMPNTYTIVLDSVGKLAPIGVRGELCIAGPQVGYGYWKNEKLSSEKFVECQYLPSVKIYRTGDLVKWNEDGMLEFIERIDRQVKLRGFRIELGEVESAALKNDGVRAVVAAVKNETLVLYYVSDADVIFQWDTLPEYMIPAVCVRLDQMPLTVNGKIDKNSLPEPIIEGVVHEAPSTTLERKIWNVVFEMMSCVELGVTDNLISYGLSSIQAMRLCVALSASGIEIKAADILSHPTIREMSEIVRKSSKVQNRFSCKIHNMREYYPLTDNQRIIYISWLHNRDKIQYNIPSAWFIPIEEINRMFNALIAVVNAHPHLKTRLVVKDGDIVQQRRDDYPPNVKIIDTDSELTVQYVQSRICPFNLNGGDLYRIEVHRSSRGVRRACVVIDIHHIVGDGLSCQIFLRDLHKALTGQVIENEKYSSYDFAIDQQKLIKSQEYGIAEKWFDSLIVGKEVTVYPHSYEGLDNPSLSSFVLEFDGTAVDEFCKKYGFTQSNYFLTAFLYLLREVTREDDLLLTTINNGRRASCMMDTIGMFVTTLPVSVSSHNSIWAGSIKSAVELVQRQQFQTQNYDFYPFTQLVERHGIHAEIMYEYQGEITDKYSEIISVKDFIDVSLHTAILPLMLSVDHGGKDGEYRFLVRYDQSLYSKADMERMLRMFAFIAGRMPVESNMTSIELLDDAFRDEVFNLCTGPHMDMDIKHTFVKAFRECAESQRNRLAVEDEDGEHSYSELDNSSNVLARELIDAELKPDCFVALLLDRTWFFPLSLLAVHKAGMAYVPLDLEYPVERLQYMLDDCRAKVLLTTRKDFEKKNQNGLDTHRIKVIYIEELDLSETVDPVDMSNPSGNAYMVYTSGSTGQPKGTVLHQAGLWNFICSIRSIYGHTAEDRIACHRSFSFVSHVEDIFIVLTVGGSLHIMPSNIRKDPCKVNKYLIEHRITGCGFIASMTKLMLKNYDLKLRYITGGGEKLSGVVSSGNPQIIHSYGPTESTDHTSVFLLETGKEYDRIPVGKPIPNNWMFVVSKNGKLLPRGVAGELCFAGIQVARGYWGKPELTAEKFVDCPFVAKDFWGRPVRMYHTGDLVRWNEDGYLEHLGRIDNQYKIRGFRIEAGEIENAALKCTGVDTAVAVVKNGTLVLYYTAEGDIDFDWGGLPDYMRPAVCVHLDYMPLNNNGKIDRMHLPEPNISKGDHIQPVNERELIIFEKVCNLLGRNDFGVTDDLNSLGLNSIRAMELALNLPEEWEINVSDVMGAKTIREMISEKHDMLRFHRKYDKSKKTIVVVHGIIGEMDLLEFEDEFSKEYNVLKIEHIFNTLLSGRNFERLISVDGYNELVRLYIQRISEVMPKGSGVSVLFGFSLGGCLAYDIACDWEALTGQQPVVVMGDSYLHLSSGINDGSVSVLLPEKEKERIHEVNASCNAQSILEYMEELLQTIRRNKKTIQKYEGRVIMINALHCNVLRNNIKSRLKEGFIFNIVKWLYWNLHIRDLIFSHRTPKVGILETKFRQRNLENLSEWRRFKPDIEVIDINTSHEGLFCDKELIKYYKELIDRC